MVDFGYSASELIAVAQLAHRTYQLVRKCGENFGKLGLDVDCLLVNVSCLSDTDTQTLIDRYVKEDVRFARDQNIRNDLSPRQREIEALKKGLEDVVLPLVVLFVNNKDLFPDESNGRKSIITASMVMSTSSKIIQAIDNAEKRPEYMHWKFSQWYRYVRAAFKLEDLAQIRARCNLHAANLNLFMTRLMQRQIQFEAETSRKQSETQIRDQNKSIFSQLQRHSEIQIENQNKAIMSQLQRQYELQALTSARQLLLRADSRYTDQIEQGVKRFEKDVAAYVAYLLDGGRPFRPDDLRLEVGLSSRVSEETRRKEERSNDGRRERERKAREDEQMLYEQELEERESRKRQEKVDAETRQKPLESIVDIDTRTKLVEASQRIALVESGFLCDECEDTIYVSDHYYTCPNKDLHTTHSSYDLCLDCYEVRYGCSNSECGPMIKTVMRMNTR